MRIYNLITELVMLQVEYGNEPTILYLHPTIARGLDKEVYNWTQMILNPKDRKTVNIPKLKTLHFGVAELEVIEIYDMAHGGIIIC